MPDKWLPTIKHQVFSFFFIYIINASAGSYILFFIVDSHICSIDVCHGSSEILSDCLLIVNKISQDPKMLVLVIPITGCFFCNTSIQVCVCVCVGCCLTC